MAATWPQDDITSWVIMHNAKVLIIDAQWVEMPIEEQVVRLNEVLPGLLHADAGASIVRTRNSELLQIWSSLHKFARYTYHDYSGPPVSLLRQIRQAIWHAEKASGSMDIIWRSSPYPDNDGMQCRSWELTVAIPNADLQILTKLLRTQNRIEMGIALAACKNRPHAADRVLLITDPMLDPAELGSIISGALRFSCPRLEVRWDARLQ